MKDKDKSKTWKFKTKEEARQFLVWALSLKTPYPKIVEWNNKKVTITKN